MTRLNAQFLSSGQFRIGIGDLRGDGRPDYRYLTRVLYADTLEPSRVGAGGGSAIEIDGIGFQTGMTVTVGTANASILSLSSNEIILSAPTAAYGTKTLSITDPANGATISLNNMLTIGAGPNDMIRLTQSINPSVPGAARQHRRSGSSSQAPTGPPRSRELPSNGARRTAQP